MNGGAEGCRKRRVLATEIRVCVCVMEKAVQLCVCVAFGCMPKNLLPATATA